MRLLPEWTDLSTTGAAQAPDGGSSGTLAQPGAGQVSDGGGSSGGGSASNGIGSSSDGGGVSSGGGGGSNGSSSSSSGDSSGSSSGGGSSESSSSAGAVAAPAGLPPGFDWQAYTFYNPELHINNSQAAEAHYLEKGRAEGRLCRRVPVFLTYNATFGLCNQLLSHMGMLALAPVFNASLTLSPAYSRHNFTHAGSIWVKEPLDSLLDVPRLVQHFEARGMRFVQVRVRDGCGVR